MIGSWRFATSQPGIETRHMFSSGAHYDPAHVSFGPVIGCDLHAVAPGAGFDWHSHRGVVIVSWLLAGELRHEGSGADSIVRPGEVLVQATGDGIRHRETNGASSVLSFVQMTLLADVPAEILRGTAPMDLPGGVRFSVASSMPEAGDDALVVETGTPDNLVLAWR